MDIRSRLVLGDPTSETQAIQLLSLALSKAASWLNRGSASDTRQLWASALMHAAGRAMTIGAVAGPETPTEILALSARNTFELYLRFKHILLAEQNIQAWRDEAVTDQLQIYEGVLALESGQLTTIIREEMERVRQHAESRGLSTSAKITRISDLASTVGLESEYAGFYKLYSKFVHPSSFTVNWPDAASTPMYRATFVWNLQQYGHALLEGAREAFGLPSEDLLKQASREYVTALEKLRKPGSR